MILKISYQNLILSKLGELLKDCYTLIYPLIVRLSSKTVSCAGRVMVAPCARGLAWGYDTPRAPGLLDHDAKVLQGIVGSVGVGLVHHGPCTLAHGHRHGGQLHQALVHSKTNILLDVKVLDLEALHLSNLLQHLAVVGGRRH